VAGLVQFGAWGGVVFAVLLGVRLLLIVVIVIWSFKADEARRAHALALLEALRLRPPTRGRSK
jgi:hypothetical protein